MNAVESSGSRSKRGRLRLADRRIRSKLALLLVAPVTAILCLSGLIALGAQSAAVGAEQARRLVALSQVEGQLAGQLQQERASAALVLTRPAGAGAVDAFQQQTQRTDVTAGLLASALSGVQVPAGLQPVVGRIRDQVAGLPLLREQVRSGQDAAASVIVFRYRALIADLIAYRAAMSQLGVDADSADGLRASATLSQAIEGLGLVQVGALPAIAAGTVTAAEQQQLVANDASFTQGLEDFRQLAPASWRAELSAETGSKAVVAGERLQALAVATQPDTPLALGTTPAGFAASLGARMAQLHGLENDVDASLVRDVTAQRDRERDQIAWLAAGVLFALVLVAAFAWWMTRSLTRPLGELFRGASDLARDRLPRIVNELIHGNPDEQAVAAAVQRAARALPVHGSDEVGAVAVALNEVAGVAAGLAGQQAALRGLNAQIARTLAYRLQTVVNQVTIGLDRLERDEQDPDRLELLFAADQQVTSANRIVNNLHFIAGGRPRQSVDGPIPVPDVVKAAISWAEGASIRVRDQRVAGDCLIVAEAVDSIVHILTELLVNALRFSPPEQDVTVSSALVGDMLYLHVDDEGIGLPDVALADIERNLAEFDLASAARRMGIPVIGLLAAPLGVKVMFRPRQPRGTSVEIVIPAALLIEKPATPIPVVHGFPDLQRPVQPGLPERPMLPQASRALAVPALIEDTALLPIAGQPAPGGERSPRLVVFDQVLHDSPFFTGHAGAGGPAVPPAWQAGSDAAEAAQQATAALATVTAGPQSSTSGGLPVRRPGQFVIPAPASAAPPIPAPRNRAATRRGMAALSRTSARKSPSSPLGR